MIDLAQSLSQPTRGLRKTGTLTSRDELTAWQSCRCHVTNRAGAQPESGHLGFCPCASRQPHPSTGPMAMQTPV